MAVRRFIWSYLLIIFAESDIPEDISDSEESELSGDELEERVEDDVVNDPTWYPDEVEEITKHSTAMNAADLRNTW